MLPSILLSVAIALITAYEFRNENKAALILLVGFTIIGSYASYLVHGLLAVAAFDGVCFVGLIIRILGSRD